MKTLTDHLFRGSRIAAATVLLTASVLAAPPVVKTVPWVDSNHLIPHTTYSGKSIRLKGTCDQQGANLQWIWDFGDGSPVATGTVANRYAIEASHAYTGATGTVFTARLTVQNTSTGETGNKAYYVEVKAKSLEVEVNVAIDEGLWFLHKSQRKTSSGSIETGDWENIMYAYGYTAANINAFEVNGHLATGNPANPYTETVSRGLNRLFQYLTTRAIGLQNNGIGSNLNPDSNGNGYGVYVNQGNPYYQGGMLIDAIVASGTPQAVALLGQAGSGANPGIVGRTYKSIVQDMVDDHAWAQYDGSGGGGWRYSAQEYPDNSACQWAAIGLLAAERQWGVIVPSWVKSWNLVWLAYTQDSSGGFGYTSPGYYPWGPYAITPSGMVQMVLDGIGRGMTGPTGMPNWDLAETFIRNNFGNSGGAGSAIKSYYYGLFSFVKSMLLYPYDTDDDLDSDPNPIKMLKSITPGVPPLDWYAAEVANGDPTDGVARTLIGHQESTGRWWGHDYEGTQQYFETAWAIMMLHRTVFESGVPVAVAKAVPNPAVAGQTITLDGSESYHQDASKHIVYWEWDLDGNGTFDTVGPIVTTSFGSLGNFPVSLRVTDDSGDPKTAVTVFTVMVNIPPLGPTADADGPYLFCDSVSKWFLDARRSSNPDEGLSEPGLPGDTIQEYAWDLDGDQQFDDAFGPTPEVKSYFSSKGPGSYLIRLRVSDTTATSFPSSGYPDLSSTASGVVTVLVSDDPACSRISLTASPQPKSIILTWDEFPGADHYNVYRSTVPDGPYTFIGSTPDLTFTDAPGVLNQVYYYVVRAAALNEDELSQSNEVAAEPTHPAPVVTCVPAAMSNLGRYYYLLGASSESFGRTQIQIFIGDTGSIQVAGPYTKGDILRIRQTSLPTVKPGPSGVKALITVKGQAKVWGVDPLGQMSDVLIFSP